MVEPITLQAKNVIVDSPLKMCRCQNYRTNFAILSFFCLLWINLLNKIFKIVNFLRFSQSFVGYQKIVKIKSSLYLCYQIKILQTFEEKKIFHMPSWQLKNCQTLTHTLYALLVILKTSISSLFNQRILIEFRNEKKTNIFPWMKSTAKALFNEIL